LLCGGFDGRVGDMGTVSIELPADLVSAARLNDGDVSKEAAKLIALELFHEDKVSMGRAAELCCTPVEAFMQFAADHAVPLHYGITELEEDRCTMERLGL
jgi:predicted HTH domain antitoxin